MVHIIERDESKVFFFFLFYFGGVRQDVYNTLV